MTDSWSGRLHRRDDPAISACVLSYGGPTYETDKQTGRDRDIDGKSVWGVGSGGGGGGGGGGGSRREGERGKD